MATQRTQKINIYSYKDLLLCHYPHVLTTTRAVLIFIHVAYHTAQVSPFDRTNLWDSSKTKQSLNYWNYGDIWLHDDESCLNRVTISIKLVTLMGTILLISHLYLGSNFILSITLYLGLLCMNYRKGRMWFIFFGSASNSQLHKVHFHLISQSETRIPLFWEIEIREHCSTLSVPA